MKTVYDLINKGEVSNDKDFIINKDIYIFKQIKKICCSWSFIFGSKLLIVSYFWYYKQNEGKFENDELRLFANYINKLCKDNHSSLFNYFLN